MEQEVTEYIKNELGIKLHHIKIMRRSNSMYAVKTKDSHRRVPYFDMYVYASSYDSVIGEYRNMGLASKEIAGKIIDFIGKLDATGFDREECYDPEMYVGVHCWDWFCYCDYVYGNKPEIEKLIFEILPVEARVYSASLPGVNIVYETEDYVNYKIEEYEERIKAAIIKAADEFVLDKYSESLSNEGFYVGIWHPKKNGYNGYGIARQD